MLKTVSLLKSEYTKEKTKPVKLVTTKNNWIKENDTILLSNSLSFLKFLIEKKNIERKGKPLSKEEVEKERKSFNVLDAARHFYTDERGEPNRFDFTIETDERIPSHIILLKALGIFKNNITN